MRHPLISIAKQSTRQFAGSKALHIVTCDVVETDVGNTDAVVSFMVVLIGVVVIGFGVVVVVAAVT